MKKNLISILLILLLSLVGITACKSDRAGNDREQNDLIALIAFRRTLDNSTDSIERRNCIEAVLVMNQCVGAGTGFSSNVMCAPRSLNTGTEANPTATPPVVAKTAAENYTSLVSCVKGKVAEYNCNFSQNKVASAKSAYDAYFKACDAPSGIINSNTF
jgi:hypothetical protein